LYSLGGPEVGEAGFNSLDLEFRRFVIVCVDARNTSVYVQCLQPFAVLAEEVGRARTLFRF
jgi:hypothetical protein